MEGRAGRTLGLQEGRTCPHLLRWAPGHQRELPAHFRSLSASPPPSARRLEPCKVEGLLLAPLDVQRRSVYGATDLQHHHFSFTLQELHTSLSAQRRSSHENGTLGSLFNIHFDLRGSLSLGRLISYICIKWCTTRTVGWRKQALLFKAAGRASEEEAGCHWRPCAPQVHTGG